MRFEVLVTPALVKAEAARRIEARYPAWRQLNVLGEGGAALAEMQAFINPIRAASNALEALNPIPVDFSADHHWTATE